MVAPPLCFGLDTRIDELKTPLGAGFAKARSETPSDHLPFPRLSNGPQSQRFDELIPAGLKAFPPISDAGDLGTGQAIDCRSRTQCGRG